jgi:hypothetical protein
MSEDKTRINWHPAFHQAIRAEFFEYRNELEYYDEYSLTSAPLKIDTMIIKLNRRLQIKKLIGQIFQLCNVVEYKSPSAMVSIFDYYKLRAYASLYAEREKTHLPDMSVTMIATHNPHKLFKYLNTEFEVNNVAPGVYYVNGEPYPTQIVVSSELPRDECQWLYSLRVDIDLDDVEQMMSQAIPESREELELDAYKDAFVQANFNKLEELKAKMDTARFHRLMQDCDWYNEAVTIGETKGEIRGKMEGEIKGKAESVLSFLKSRFKKVPQNIEQAVLSYTDLTALDSLIQCAAVCGSIEEFSDSLVNK